MGNAAAKEFKEKPLGSVADLKLHEEGRNAFAANLVTTEVLTLRGKSIVVEGKGGYKYFQLVEGSKEDNDFFSVKVQGAVGRKGAVFDGDKKNVAEVRIEHHFKNDVHRIYKTKPCFPDQETQDVDGASLYLFAKIEANRTSKGASSTYSIVTGKGEGEELSFVALYKSEQVVSMSFMALIETVPAEEGSPAVTVGKITPLRGPRLQLEVASGVDLAAVILVGNASSPTGGSMAALPGATFY